MSVFSGKPELVI